MLKKIRKIKQRNESKYISVSLICFAFCQHKRNKIEHECSLLLLYIFTYTNAINNANDIIHAATVAPKRFPDNVTKHAPQNAPPT